VALEVDENGRVKRVSYCVVRMDTFLVSRGACSDLSEMQMMERLLFEEFRGQQELDSGEKNRLDGIDNFKNKKRKHPNFKGTPRWKSRRAMQRASEQA
jgi:hypothetical protein